MFKYNDREVQAIVAGALYDFAAKLTTLKEPVTFSEKHLSYPAIDILVEFAKDRNLILRDAKVEDWNKLICEQN